MSETTQRARETDEKKSRGLRRYVVWALVAVLVYVLSSGPVVMLMDQRQTKKFQKSGGPIKMTLLDNVVGFIYTPIEWLYNTDTFHKPLGKYWHLWTPRYNDEGDVEYGPLKR